MTHYRSHRRNWLNTTAMTRFCTVSTLAIFGVVSAAAPALAVDVSALPTGGVVASGAASFDYAGNTLTIQQNTNNVVIDWNSFDIGVDAITQFLQGNSNATAVNRIHDAKPSQILGQLRADGRVVLLNSNGVLFGRNASVDVSGLVASTGKIDAEAFMRDGSVRLFDINTGGAVQNDGLITIHNAGLAAFVAPSVINNGVIQARLGKIALAAGGNTATVDLYGDGLVEMALGEDASRALIDNTGTLKADGGVIAVTAKGARDVVDNVVNMGGIVEANSVGVKNGKIILGGTNADIRVSGTVSATGGDGQIDVRSDRNIDVTSDAVLTADAGEQGNGGIIELIAQRSLAFLGTIYARGGTRDGNGGFVDTSGLESVNIDGKVDASAANGKGGTWLIDPRDLWVGSYLSYGNVNLFTSRANINSVISSLNSGTNVTLTTVGGTGFGDGDIIIDGTINKTAGGNATLTLNAVGDILFNSGNGISSSAGALSLAFNAGGDITVNRTLNTNGGNINFTANDDIWIERNITTSGGAMTFAANDTFFVETGDSVNSNGGAISVYADVFDLDGTINAGTAGTITIARQDGIGRISVGDDNGGMRISQSELGRMTARSLVIGRQTSASKDNDIVVDNADLDAFTAVTLQTRRNDSSSSQDIIFRGTNAVAGLTVFSDDEIELDQNAVLSAIGNVSLTGNTNGLSSGDFHVDNNARLDLNGNNLTTTALNTVIDDGAVIDAEGGNIALSNANTFFSDDANSVRTTGTGIINLNQNVGGSIQNAIDAIQNTGTGLNTISVGAGTFNESVSVYENNFLLKGAANHASVIDPNSPGFNVTGNDVTIDGFTITGTSGVDGFGVLVNGGNNAAIRNNVINNTTANAIQILNSTGSSVTNNFIGYTNPTTMGAANNIKGDGVYGSNTVNFSVAGNLIANTQSMAFNNGSGVQVVNGTTTAISANTIATTGWDGVRVAGGTGATILNNIITSVTRTGIYLGNVATAMVSGNSITGTGSHFGIDVANGSAITLDGNTLSATAQDAIKANAVSSLVINDNDIGLGGAVGNIGANGITVSNSENAQITDNEIENAKANGIFVSLSNGAQILRNWVKGSAVGAMNVFHKDGITVQGGSNQLVANNIVDNAGWDGIYINGTTNTLVRRNTVSNAYRSGITVASSQDARVRGNTLNDNWGGMWIEGNTNTTITGNTINGTTESHGIHALNNTILTIGGATNAERNRINDAALNAVNVITSDTVTVTNNSIRRAGVNGVEIANSNKVSVTDNNIRRSGANGVLISNSFGGILVDGNTIHRSALDGVRVYGNSFPLVIALAESEDDVTPVTPADDVVISNNTISNSGQDGVDVSGNLRSLIHTNTISNSTVHGVTVTGQSDVFYPSYSSYSFFGPSPIMSNSNTTIRDNIISNSDMNGVNVRGVVTSWIGGNTVTTSGHDGIYVFGGYNRMIESVIEAPVEEGDDYSDGDYMGGSFSPFVMFAPYYTTSIVGNTVDASEGNGISANALNEAYIGYRSVETPVEDSEETITTLVGNVVRNSLSSSIESWDVGNGILVGDVFTSTIEGNTIENSDNNGIRVTRNVTDNGGTDGDVGYPIFFGYGAAPSYTTTIVDNNVSNTRWNNGITVNSINTSTIGDGDDADTIGNVITNSGWDGIQVTGQSNWLFDSVISGSGAFYDMSMPGTFVTLISDNSITNSYNDGIDVGYLDQATISRNVIRNDRPIIIDDEAISDIVAAEVMFDDEGPKKLQSVGINARIIDQLIVDNNSVDYADIGISINNINDTTLDTNLLTNIVDIGINVDGAYNQSVVLIDNDVQSEFDGAHFASGAIDFQGDNRFDSVNDGLVFDANQLVTAEEIIDDEDSDEGFPEFLTFRGPRIVTSAPSDLSVVGNSFGTTQFENQEGFYIRLANGALFNPGTPTILDARFSSFDGFVPGSFFLSLTQLQQLEAKLFDFDDQITLGQIFFTNLGGVDQRLLDLGRFFNGGDGTGANGLVVITGQPFAFLPGNIGGNFANIAPAAGGNADDLNDIDTAAGGDQPADPEALNALETAAGGEQSACWGSVVNASTSGPVAYSLNDSPDSLLNDQQNCQQQGSGLSL